MFADSPFRIVITASAVWLFAFVLLTAVSATEGVKDMLETVGPRSALMAEADVVSILIALWMGRPGARSIRLQIMTCVCLVFAASIQSGVVGYFLTFLRHETPADRITTAVADAVYMFWLYVALAGIYFSTTLSRQLRDQEIRSATAVAAALQAQNSMLRYQINPHFLFNTLNAIATLILDRKNDVAEQVVLSVSRFLRFSLEHGLDDKVSLQREIEAQELYLSIERVRFGERFAFAADIPQALAGALVPSLILQPLVENAVKYAVAPTTALVRVVIVAAERAGRLQISVEDSGGATPSSGAIGLGVGLSNVRARLAALYGAQGELTCERLQPHGFRARLSLPLEFS